MCVTLIRHQVPALLLQSGSSNWCHSRSDDILSTIFIFIFSLLVLPWLWLVLSWLLLPCSFPPAPVSREYVLWSNMIILISLESRQLFFPLLSCFRLLFSCFCLLFYLFWIVFLETLLLIFLSNFCLFYYLRSQFRLSLALFCEHSWQ